MPASHAAAQSSSPAFALEARGLARSYGPVRAVRGVDFGLMPGAALAIFGPNGAGKTTLLRMLAGLARPDRGAIWADGEPLARGAATARRVGLISHASMLYDGLTAEENLAFAARLYGLSEPPRRAREALDAAGLLPRAGSAVGTMSRGMIQRVAIARALLHDPAIVLLDEPFTGLDQAAAAALTGRLLALRDARRTLVLVTHNIDEGLALASDVAIMVAGRFTECGPRDAAGAVRRRYDEAVRG